MASALYDKGRQAFGTGLIDWTTADVRCVLIDSADYTVNLATHEFLSDVPAAARVATTAASLANKTINAGVADADDTVFPGGTGDESEAVILYVHTGVDATARLICYLDNCAGLPVTPNGLPITLTWDSGSNRIFKL